jgi:hypothetical protein
MDPIQSGVRHNKQRLTNSHENLIKPSNIISK